MTPLTTRARPSTGGYVVETITTLDGLMAIEAEWHALARPQPSPLVQFDWFVCAAEAFPEDDLFVVTVRREGALCAAAPLVLRQCGGVRQLEALGHRLGEPQRLLHADEEALGVLVEALARQPFALALRKIPADGPERHAFARVARRGLQLVTGADSRASFVPLAGGVEGRVSGKRRASLRKGLRLAEARGPVAFRFVHPGPAELEPLLDEVFRVEASGWKARAGTALRQDAALGGFFRSYARRMAALGALRLGFMTIGDATAAVRLEVEWGGASWDLKVGYDERFAAASPGLLLCHRALLHGAARGLATHHFLGEYEPWHDCWDAEQAPQVTLRHYGLSAGAGAALARDALARLRGSLDALRVDRRVTTRLVGGIEAVQLVPLPL